MDRENDLTIEALIARRENPQQMLDEQRAMAEGDRRDAFKHVLGIKRQTDADLFFENIGPAVTPKPDDMPWDLWGSWERIFSTPHIGHVQADPYSFMWGDDETCDRCGGQIHAMNRPDLCYGVCLPCEKEIKESPEGSL